MLIVASRRRILKNPIATSKMKPLVALAGGFHTLTNVTKNSISGVASVLDPPLEYNNLF